MTYHYNQTTVIDGWEPPEDYPTDWLRVGAMLTSFMQGLRYSLHTPMTWNNLREYALPKFLVAYPQYKPYFGVSNG